MIGTPEIQTSDAVPPPTTSTCGDWRLYEYETVTSTNLIAANLDAWTAVRADTQTGGRGRFQRAWISDCGGLWLSAVVPFSEGPVARRSLPLAAGLALCNVLRELGVSNLRLRWPNDVMVNNRKLAGLLIDQFVPGRAVIGIGLNVSNRPEKRSAALEGQTARLADLLPAVPDLTALTRLVLEQVQRTLTELAQTGASVFFLEVNKLWGASQTVELDLDGKPWRGFFKGVDAEGRLLLADEAGKLAYFEAHEVGHLTEMECVL